MTRDADIERIAAVLDSLDDEHITSHRLGIAAALYDAGLRPSVEPAGMAERNRLRVALERAADALDTVREGLNVTDPSAIVMGAESILRHAARETRLALLPTQASDSPEKTT